MTQRKKKGWRMPVIAGFLSLYTVTMVLSTYLVKCRYLEEFHQRHVQKLNDAHTYLMMEGWTDEEGYPINGQAEKYICQFNLNSLLAADNRYQQFSAALYDAGGKRFIETQDSIRIYDYPYHAKWGRYGWFSHFTAELPVAEYMPQEIQDEMGQYAYLCEKYSHEKALQEAQEKGKTPDVWTEYTLMVSQAADNGICRAYVQQTEWEKTEYEGPDSSIKAIPENFTELMDTRYRMRSGRTVWEWKDVSVSDEEAGDGCRGEFTCPYIEYGQKAWKSWKENAYLHDFPEDLGTLGDYQEEKINLYMYGGGWGRIGARVRSVHPVPGENGESIYSLFLVSECHPWLAAVDYMKYVYLACLALTLVCMGKILYVTERAYRQQAALEESRRDFINAMAHELKTPLGVIRGFAENLKEHVKEDKRDYYLTQIIRQTEDMDRLAMRMLEVSRLEGEGLAPRKETVALGALIKEQMEQFEALIKEQGLAVQYEGEEEFIVEGDREYLAQAVRNLLSNAASYSTQGGSIVVRTGKDGCSIENTAAPLAEEQLAYIFVPPGGSAEKGTHKGMGLYLTKKILASYRLDIVLENTRTGVRAVIKQDA